MRNCSWPEAVWVHDTSESTWAKMLGLKAKKSWTGLYGGTQNCIDLFQELSVRKKGQIENWHMLAIQISSNHLGLLTWMASDAKEDLDGFQQGETWAENASASCPFLSTPSSWMSGVVPLKPEKGSEASARGLLKCFCFLPTHLKFRTSKAGSLSWRTGFMVYRILGCCEVFWHHARVTGLGSRS